MMHGSITGGLEVEGADQRRAAGRNTGAAAVWRILLRKEGLSAHTEPRRGRGGNTEIFKKRWRQSIGQQGMDVGVGYERHLFYELY